MADMSKKGALENQHPISGDVQDIVYGEVRVKHSLRR
jgi:hypothetical protein